MGEQRPADRLAAAMKSRRAELGRTQDDVIYAAKASGHPVAGQTYRDAEAGKRDIYRDPTLVAIDAGLDWEPGTAAGFFGGDRQFEAPGGSLARDLPDLEAAYRQRLIDVAVPARKLTDAEAVLIVLGCLTDDQFAMFARAVQADDRFASL